MIYNIEQKMISPTYVLANAGTTFKLMCINNIRFQYWKYYLNINKCHKYN
jgi:hypothetical protein